MTPVKDALKIAYGDDVYDEAFDGVDDQLLLERAGNVTKGVPIATPVFDGAKEANVNDALSRAGFDTSGQSVICLTGARASKFARKVTVGVKYLLKLHHLGR
jgi:DNA-directed RNA polymerase subunit beta